MAAVNKPYHPNPYLIKMFAERTKCWMCKHRFEKPVLLPVKKIKPGKLQPNINTEVLWHLSDTHGLAAETVSEWIVGTIYGMEINEMGIKGVDHSDSIIL